MCVALAALLAQVETTTAAPGLAPEAAADAVADELMRDPDAADLFAVVGGVGAAGEAGAAPALREAVLAVAEGQRGARGAAGGKARALLGRVRAAQAVLERKR